MQSDKLGHYKDNSPVCQPWLLYHVGHCIGKCHPGSGWASGLRREERDRTGVKKYLCKHTHLLLKHHACFSLLNRLRLYTYCTCLSSFAKFMLCQTSHAFISPSVPAHPLSLASTLFEWVRGTSFTCQAVKTAASCVDTSQMPQLKHLTERVAIKRCALADVLMEVTQSCQIWEELAVRG